MTPTQPIVFFGTADFSVASLRQLITDGYTIAAVITKPDAPVGRKRVLTPPAVKTVAAEYDIPVMQPEKLGDITDELKQLGATAGVVVSYGKLIPQSILDIFTDTLVNTHASLLPKWRGASPIESAILSGDDKTGVTLMRVEAGLDSGAMYASGELKLHGTETRPELYDELAVVAAQLLHQHLPAILSGELQPEPQNDTEATTCGLISKANGQIDWSQPAEVLERHVRAYLGWPGSQAHLFNRDITITMASVPDLEEAMMAAEIEQDHLAKFGVPYITAGRLLVTTGNGILEIDRLKPAGGRDMAAADFVRGIPR